MIVDSLQHYDTWDKHALDFMIATSTFQKMITRVISLMEQRLGQKFIKNVKWRIKDLNSILYKLPLCLVCKRCKVPAKKSPYWSIRCNETIVLEQA